MTLTCRRAALAVALCGLLAGCSEKAGPTSAQRSICKTVRTQLDVLDLNQGSLPNKAEDIAESKHLLGHAVSSSVSTFVFIRSAFVHDLTQSDDPTFQRLGTALKQRTGVVSPISQLDARCRSLGL